MQTYGGTLKETGARYKTSYHYTNTCYRHASSCIITRRAMRGAKKKVKDGKRDREKRGFIYFSKNLQVVKSISCFNGNISFLSIATGLLHLSHYLSQKIKPKCYSFHSSCLNIVPSNCLIEEKINNTCKQDFWRNSNAASLGAW